MKNYYFALVLIPFLSLSQIPTGYYNTATGSGYTLKTQLHNIIKNSHDPKTYASIWGLYTQDAFRDYWYENNGTLLDMYSENPDGPDAYEYYGTSTQCTSDSPLNEGDCYNREHLVPQSVFRIENVVDPIARADAHHLPPSDGKVNAWRGDLPFGIVSGSNLNPCNTGGTNLPCHTSNFSKKGWLDQTFHQDTSGNINVFEPINEFKGDIARALLYFATRYQDQIINFYNQTTSGFKVCLNGTSDQVFNNTFLNILIKWHLQDAVSAKEIVQNNAIYSHQNNRNPFVDTPNYVCQIWPMQCQALSTQPFDFVFQTQIYPNPVNDGLVNINANQDISTIQIYNLHGQVILNIENIQDKTYIVTTNHLTSGLYFIKIYSENQTETKKLIIN